MDNKGNENKSKELKDEFDRILGENRNMDIANYVVKPETLSETPFGQKIEIYDYDKDMTECLLQAIDVVQSLASLYLSDNQVLLNHIYIKNKIKEDSGVYAGTLFTSRMAKRLLISTLKRIDALDNNSRRIEVCNQTLKEVRENIEFESTQRTELEKFYKEIRKDFGLDEEIKSDKTEEENTKKVEGTNLDGRDLNNKINEYLKSKT